MAPGSEIYTLFRAAFTTLKITLLKYFPYIFKSDFFIVNIIWAFVILGKCNHSFGFGGIVAYILIIALTVVFVTQRYTSCPRVTSFARQFIYTAVAVRISHFISLSNLIYIFDF